MTNLDQEKNSFELHVELFEKGQLFSSLKFNKSPISIGRAEDCDIHILDKLISRNHAQFVITGGEIYVQDLNSSNGVYVNGQKVTQEKVDSTSLIKIGNKIIKIVLLTQQKSATSSAIVLEDNSSHELTLSRIAFSFQKQIDQKEAAAVGVADHQDDSSVMSAPLTNKNFVAHLTEAKVKNKVTNAQFHKIESLVIWNNVIYDMNEFGKNQKIDIGPDRSNAIQVQSINYQWTLSQYDFEEAHFEVPQGLPIYLMRDGEFLTKDHLQQEGRIKEGQKVFKVIPSLYDVIRIELDPWTQLYFRYVPSETDLDRKKLISPDEFLKKALQLSLVVHLVLSVIIFLIPSDKIKPIEPKQEPERVARLIMDKPAEPPPLPIPEPEPEPKKEEPPPPEPPKPEEPKPEPPPPPKVEVKPPPVKPEIKKVKPQKPKPAVPQKLPPAPKKPQVVYEEVEVQEEAPVVQKAQPAPVMPKQEPQPQAPPKPAPPPVDVNKLGALAAISGLKLSNTGTQALPKDIKISNTAVNTKVNENSPVGSVSSLSKDIKQEVGATGGQLSTGPIKTKGKTSTGSSYGGEGIGADTGKRGVKASVIGKPALKFEDTSKPEGLSREQIMKVMQAQMSKIQNCYERALLNDSNLAGRIEFEWEISAGGQVTSVEVKKNSVAGGEQLGECVSGVIRGTKFPAATNGQTTKPSIGFPFGRL